MAAAQDHRRRVSGLAIALVVLSLSLTALTARRPMIAASLHGSLSEVLRPAQIAASFLVGSITNFFDGYIALVGTKAENEALHERLLVLEAHQSRVTEIEGELLRLQNLLSLRDSYGSKGVAARVISHDASTWGQTITVNRGSGQGVEVGSAVVQQYGLVGQVVAVGPSTSKILLITDPVSGVDGLIQSTRVRGVVEGVGIGRCMWRFVLRDEEVKVGERVVTSGMDGVFPRGVLLGVVADVRSAGEGMFHAVEIEPTIDFTKIEEVLILPKGVLEAPLVPVQSDEPPKSEAQ